MSKFDQPNHNVDSQFNAARDIHNIVNNHIPAPVEVIKAAWSTASKCFQSMLPKGHDHSKIAASADYLRKLEKIEKERLELEKINSTRRAHTEDRMIQLKEEETELRKEDLKWKKLAFQESLKSIEKSQTIALKSLELKEKELQSRTDMHYLHLQGTRDDIIQIFSQDKGKFIIIPSDPEISREDMPAFKSLKAEIPYKLKHIIEKYYGKTTRKAAIGYRDILNTTIKETNALVVGRFLVPIPTLIFRSQVTHQKILISMTLTCPAFKTVTSQTKTSEQQSTEDINQENFSLPEWNWMDIKKELELQGQDNDESSQIILDLITTIHLIVALYFCDLYCLNLDPNHNPKLFEFLKEPNFPKGLQTWAKPLESFLKKTQNKIVNRVKKELDRTRTLEAKKSSLSYSENYSDFGDFFDIPAIVSGVGLIFLLAMCSQQFPNMIRGNTSIQNSIEQQQGRTGIIRVNRPDANSARLRVVPEQDGEVIDMLPNGTPVVLGKVSSNGLWQKVTAKDGKSGWVWAEFIQK